MSAPAAPRPNVVELRGIRKVFRQVLAPQESRGLLARLFRRGQETAGPDGGLAATPKGASKSASDSASDSASKSAPTARLADAQHSTPTAPGNWPGNGPSNGSANGGHNGGSNGEPNGGSEGVEVLSDITLDIARGEFVALQGTSGSGKSTLLHLLGLLDRPTAGTYRLLGRDVSGMDDDELSHLRNMALGFVFQSFYLVPYATALENVLLPGMYSDRPQAALRQRALELLERVGLADRVHFKPANLSGGQQQRVAMARALLNEPELILADEPTGQLDSATSQEIMRLFAQVNATGTSIVLVTHDEAVARQAGRVIRLADGRILSDDSVTAR